MHTSVLVPPSSIKSFEQHLRSTTALTPTQHGGGGLGSIVSIVAAVAIPWAAPAIASSIGISAALGPTLGGALVGAGLGAATAAATGQNIGIGALTGGFGGGISGYMGTPAGVDPFTGNPISVAPAGSGAAGLGYAPNALTTTMPTTTGVQSAIEAGSAVGLQDLAPGMNPNDPTYGLSSAGSTNPGTTLSGGEGLTQQVNYSPTVTPRDFAAANNFPMDELGNYYGPNGQVIPPSATASGQPIVRDLSTNMGAVRGIPPGSPRPLVDRYPVRTRFGGPAPESAAFRAAQGELTLGDRLGGFFSDPIAGLKRLPDPVKKGLGDLLTQQAANFLASEPEITPGEQAALDQRAQIMRMEEAEQARRRELGDQYMQQAQAINPVQLGMESAADAARRYERASRAGLRNLTGDRRVAGQRRAALDQARLGGSAFNQGFGRGLEQRMAAISRAANTGANVGSLYDMASADLAAATTARNRLNAERANAAGLVSPLVAQGLFGITDEERKRQQERTIG